MKKIFIAVLAIAFMSCNKDDDKARHGIELMTQRSWILSAKVSGE